MAQPLTASMPGSLDIGGNYTLRFDAVSLTTDATIPNVTVSGGLIYGDIIVPNVGDTGPVPGQPPGGAPPYLLVPGSNS